MFSFRRQIDSLRNQVIVRKLLSKITGEIERLLKCLMAIISTVDGFVNTLIVIDSPLDYLYIGFCSVCSYVSNLDKLNRFPQEFRVQRGEIYISKVYYVYFSEVSRCNLDFLEEITFEGLGD